MTFLIKPSFVGKKAPLIDEKYDEVIEVHGARRRDEPRGLGAGALVFLTLATIFVTLMGIATGFALYRQYIRSTSVARYQGFCTIPISAKDPYYEANYRVMPLRWSSEPDVQVFSTASEDVSDELVSALREELEIADSVEKISIVDNGRHVNFIHDFDANLTGIVDAQRCFTMELEPSLVLAPEVFVMSIEGGAEFDVSRVRSTLRAALPQLAQIAAAAKDLVEKCLGKPTYNLVKEEGLIIRKRGVDAPPHDYIQFSGRHVQEIEIVNLADLLQHEQAARAD